MLDCLHEPIRLFTKSPTSPDLRRAFGQAPAELHDLDDLVVLDIEGFLSGRWRFRHQ